VDDSFTEAGEQPGAATTPPSALSRTALLAHRQISLAETLDRVLNKGVVLVGEVTLSVADIDLLYLGLNIILTSVETMERFGRGEAPDGRAADRI